jgi:hypothetical protein
MVRKAEGSPKLSIRASPLPTKDLAHIYILSVRIWRDEHSALSPLPAMTEQDFSALGVRELMAHRLKTTGRLFGPKIARLNTKGQS